jgi:hypothetical protein
MSKQVVIDTVSNFLDIVETRINTAIENGGSIGGTDLATEIAVANGLTVGGAVAIISMYVASRPELVSKRGKGGGIQRVKA